MIQPPVIYAEVCKDLKNDPLKPNRLSKLIEALGQKFDRHREALREIAKG